MHLVMPSICQQFVNTKYEPHHEKTNILHMQKQKGAVTAKLISAFVTAKLISAFVFATWIVQFLNIPNPKFPVSSVHVPLGLCWTCSENTVLVFS